LKDSDFHQNDDSTSREEFPKKYDPKIFEDKIYINWEDNGKFIPNSHPTPLSNERGKIIKDTFYIPMPPPNVTAKLHVGHSIVLTLEDIMTRYHRMK
jgi:valyl-tRNA synthetase